MPSSLLRAPFSWVLVLLFAPAGAGAAGGSLRYETDVKPLLQTYCYKCHGGAKVKGDVNLAPFGDEASVLRDARLWRDVVQQIRDHDMPPGGKPQPNDEERRKLLDWGHTVLLKIDAGQPLDPGRVTLHRLNRTEYNNTIRDLLGVDTKPADLFPADGAGGAGFDNNADTLFIPPILMEQYLKAADDVLKQADPNRLFVSRPNASVKPREAAERCLTRFARLAFRGPAGGDETRPLLRLFDLAQKRGDGFEDSVKLAMKGALVSPRFLFRLEQDRASKAPYPVSDYELASRLSYFVWSSMPDEELLALADTYQLHDPAVLGRQVRRMLKDSKAKALAEQFGAQWLQIRDLKGNVQPDRRRFKDFTPALRDALYDEAVEFVGSVFRGEKSLLTLLNADYVVVNEELARFYGLPNVKGEELREVKLADNNRGGILGLGAVLTVTSYPLRTSPVLRGKWVLDVVLGAPPPPPPPDVIQLPADDRVKDGLTFRKRLEMHRARPECASCHNRMDPLGFGLENFDAVGRWRTTSGEAPVDSAGILTTGETFTGPAELKTVLLQRKEEFVRNLTEKMLAYALGRGLEYYDQRAVGSIVDDLAKHDDNSARLVADVVASYPFRYRRNDAGETGKE